jgi:hypothetical protein
VGTPGDRRQLRASYWRSTSPFTFTIPVRFLADTPLGVGDVPNVAAWTTIGGMVTGLRRSVNGMRPERAKTPLMGAMALGER